MNGNGLPPWAPDFLRELKRTAEHGRIRPTIACQFVGVSKAYVYRLRASPQGAEFRKLWDLAALEVLQHELQSQPKRSAIQAAMREVD